MSNSVQAKLTIHLMGATMKRNAKPHLAILIGFIFSFTTGPVSAGPLTPWEDLSPEAQARLSLIELMTAYTDAS